MVLGSTSLQQTTFVIVDLETTGASPKTGAAITEIGAVKVKSGEHHGEFKSFVNPLTPIPDYITQMTGITDLMLLSTLAQFFGTKTEPNHRALDDAKATTEILHGLIERLGSFDVHTVDALMEFAKTAAHIQRKNYWGLSSI